MSKNSPLSTIIIIIMIISTIHMFSEHGIFIGILWLFFGLMIITFSMASIGSIIDTLFRKKEE